MSLEHPDEFELQVRHRAKVRTRQNDAAKFLLSKAPYWLKNAGLRDFRAIIQKFRIELMRHITDLKGIHQVFTAMPSDSLIWLHNSLVWKELEELVAKSFSCWIAAKRRELWLRVDGLPDEIQFRIFDALYPDAVYQLEGTASSRPSTDYLQPAFAWLASQSLIDYYVEPVQLEDYFSNVKLTCSFSDEALMGPGLHAKYLKEWYQRTLFEVDMTCIKSFLSYNPWGYSFLARDEANHVGIVVQYCIDVTNSPSKMKGLEQKVGVLAKTLKEMPARNTRDMWINFEMQDASSLVTLITLQEITTDPNSLHDIIALQDITAQSSEQLDFVTKLKATLTQNWPEFFDRIPIRRVEKSEWDKDGEGW